MMIALNGKPTPQQFDAAYPCAVDIPIPGCGLGYHVNAIQRDVAAVRGWAWRHHSAPPDGRSGRRSFVRCGFPSATSADAFVQVWRTFDAARIR